MERRKSRVRGSNWNHEQTMALAELKREATLNNEDGRLVWEGIAQTLSSRFPSQIRTADQCRMRWDTLVKIYNHIEDFCVQTGAQGHRDLDQGELASMKLATAYHQDWYDIVEQVCSQRKRNQERCDRDLILSKRSKGSSYGSEYFELLERPDSLGSASTRRSVTYPEQFTPEPTTTYAQFSSSPSLEVDKLSPEEELPSFRIGNDASRFEAPQLWQHGQVYDEVSQDPQTLESANQLPYNFPAWNGVQLNEPLQHNWWDLIDFEPFETSTEIDQSENQSNSIEPFNPPMVSAGLGVQPNKQLQDHVRDDSDQENDYGIVIYLPEWDFCELSTTFLAVRRSGVATIFWGRIGTSRL